MEFMTKYNRIAGIPPSMGQLPIEQHSNRFVDAIMLSVSGHAQSHHTGRRRFDPGMGIFDPRPSF